MGIWLMDDYRSRLITESLELKEKITKLKAFIDGKGISKLHQIDKDLLRNQYGVMKHYHDILETRLAR